MRDPLFVYVLVAGVALTGLLLLGDLHRLEEILAPSTLLVVLALVCLHAERAFPEGEDGPFSRRRFGLAFFWSAQVLLAAGLLLLLGAQLVGLLHGPILRHLGLVSRPSRTRPPALDVLLVLAGTYA